MLTRHQIFTLQLLTTAGCEVHAEMRQALIPGTANAHLLGAIFGGEGWDGVEVTCGKRRTEQLRFHFERSCVWNMALHPDLIEGCIAPIGEQADAVRTRKEFIEVILQLRQRQVFVNILPHLKGRRNIECKLCDHAESAQTNNGTVKVLTVLFAR